MLVAGQRQLQVLCRKYMSINDLRVIAQVVYFILFASHPPSFGVYAGAVILWWAQRAARALHERPPLRPSPARLNLLNRSVSEEESTLTLPLACAAG